MTATSSGQMCAVSVCVCSLKSICDAQEMPHAQYPMESCIVEVCCIAQIATHTRTRRDPSMYTLCYMRFAYTIYVPSFGFSFIRFEFQWIIDAAACGLQSFSVCKTIKFYPHIIYESTYCTAFHVPYPKAWIPHRIEMMMMMIMMILQCNSSLVYLNLMAFDCFWNHS